MSLRSLLAKGEPLLQSDRRRFEDVERPAAAVQCAEVASVLGSKETGRIGEIVDGDDVTERKVDDRKERIRVDRLLRKSPARVEGGTGKGEREGRESDEEPVSKRVKISRTLNDADVVERSREDIANVFGASEVHEGVEALVAAAVSLLLSLLTSSAWQHRHGAIVTLLELFQLWPAGERDSRVKALVVSTCCVLTLDRFGDFASDAVVGPVTEPCAQLFARCCQVLPDGLALGLRLMKELLEAGEKQASSKADYDFDFWDINPWNARFSAMLGLKYLLALELTAMARIDARKETNALEIVAVAARRIWTDDSEDVSALITEILSTALSFSAEEDTTQLVRFIAHPESSCPDPAPRVLEFCFQCWKRLGKNKYKGEHLRQYTFLLLRVTQAAKCLCTPSRFNEVVVPEVNALLEVLAQGPSQNCEPTLKLIEVLLPCLSSGQMKSWVNTLLHCSFPLEPKDELYNLSRSIWMLIGRTDEITEVIFDLFAWSKSTGSSLKPNTCSAIAIILTVATKREALLRALAMSFEEAGHNVELRWSVLYILLQYAQWATTPLWANLVEHLKATQYLEPHILSQVPSASVDSLNTKLAKLLDRFEKAGLRPETLHTFRSEQHRLGVIEWTRLLTADISQQWLETLSAAGDGSAARRWAEETRASIEDVKRLVEQASAELIFFTRREEAGVAMLQLSSQRVLPEKLNPVLKPILAATLEANGYESAALLCRFAARSIDYTLSLCSAQKAAIVEQAITQKLCVVGLSSTHYDVQQLVSELVLLKKDKLFQVFPSLWEYLGDILTAVGIEEAESEAWIVDHILSYELALLSDPNLPAIIGRVLTIVHTLLRVQPTIVPPETAKLIPALFIWFNVTCCSDDSFVSTSLREAVQAVIIAAVGQTSYFTEVWTMLLHVVVQMLESPFLVASRETNAAQATQTSHYALGLLTEVVHVKHDVVLANLSSLVPSILKLMTDATKSSSLNTAASKLFSQVIARVSIEVFEAQEGLSTNSVETLRHEGNRFLKGLLEGVGADAQESVQRVLEAKLRDGLKLRHYQKEAISWLSFMAKYGLSCALCDDLGLGKTLMTLSAIALLEKPCLSIIVCPTSVIGHWVQEADQFFRAGVFQVVAYVGDVRTRKTVVQELEKLLAMERECHILLVLSYSILKKDLDAIEGAMEGAAVGYCILDEAHMIRNHRTVTSQACKEIGRRAPLRLALTGTPVHNDVSDLWSIFDYLLPGYLGTVKEFEDAVAKGVRSGQGALGSDAVDMDTLALAGAAMSNLNKLHAKLLPFTMRRLKDDVLSDLPPKIIQDLFVELTPVQEELVRSITQRCRKDVDKTDVVGNVFALMMICTHPLLYLRKRNESAAIANNRVESMQVARQLSVVKDQGISASCKFGALKQLLQDIGLGTRPEAASLGVAQTAPRKALIFTQYTATLEILEKQLLAPANMSYLRLDGTVAPGKRQTIVNQFNQSSGIDLLILTKRVGGQGLNLTGADTVIFLEHDWNPMVDVQAMDRAHRLGQNRTVNVYRILTKNTLEGKLMNAQRYKLRVANTVIDDDNSALEKMRTDTLLELFEGTNEKAQGETTKSGRVGKVAELLKEIGELWDEYQYKDLSVSAFLEKTR